MALFPSFVDRQFARFCKHGDPAALGAVFDRTAAELLRIACYLSGNRTDAEDLVQRTFLAAIERRTAYERERRALPWLCGILANLARQLQRERERARAARLAAPDAPSADPSTDAAERELAARLAAICGELGAPYADVLRLHLEQGLSAKEIAGRLGRPAGTVRTQLMRALQVLRQRLPDGFVAGGVVALLAGSASASAGTLAAMRAVVVRAAGTPVASSAAGAVVAVTGSWLVSKKIVLAVSLVLAAVVWGVWPVDAATGPSVPGPNPDAPLAAAAAGTHDEPATAAAPAREVVAVAPAPADSEVEPGFATLVVRARRGNEPAGNLGVYASNGSPVARRDAVTDAAGIAVLVHLQPGAWQVGSTLGSGGMGGMHTPPMGVELAAGERRELELLVRSTATAHGVVVDRDDRPVADARIWLSIDGDSAHGHEVTRSAADGTFTVPVVGAHYVGARKSGFAPSHTFIADAGKPGDVLRLELRHPGGEVRGLVQDERGQPVAFATGLRG
ncbi:MAG: sigma-70 family RNA polymerase sigma factor, partial [Planctomycetes bacterium]|nr:sigma-70 family RNA polymerase sigma factor [Planctomycetota bacterium]